jgi:hypothetical protein
VTVPQAVQQLASLAVEFSAPLDVERSARFLQFVAWVRVQPTVVPGTPGPQLSTVLALHGRASIQGATFGWSLTDDQGAVQTALRNGALVLIDVDCDYLTDIRGNPVSGSAGALADIQTFRPGGIFRSWIQVRLG